jgi:oligoribonuclease (3'-5' exoribonuclease)
MNEKIMEKMGFVEEVDLVKHKKCPFCKVDITAQMLEEMNFLELKEHRISGLCKKCIDEMFG